MDQLNSFKINEIDLNIEKDENNGLFRIKSINTYDKEEAKIFCDKYLNLSFNCILSKV